VDALGHTSQYAAAVLLFGLARTVISHITGLIALKLVLRGSQPAQRPRLLRGFADCMPSWGGGFAACTAPSACPLVSRRLRQARRHR
jgi:hypothetical protein